MALQIANHKIPDLNIIQHTKTKKEKSVKNQNTIKWLYCSVNCRLILATHKNKNYRTCGRMKTFNYLSAVIYSLPCNFANCNNSSIGSLTYQLLLWELSHNRWEPQIHEDSSQLKQRWLARQMEHPYGIWHQGPIQDLQ